MDYLFSPWRYSYVTSPKDDGGCVFCRLASSDPSADATSLVIHRGDHHFVVLNAFPYTSGHLMIVPYAHVARLTRLEAPALGELAELTARAEEVLERAYRPDGINFGLNVGQGAGAGIAEHLHLHAVPRWSEDTNFMTVIGETRVLPESLEESWRRLHGRFEEAS